MVTGAFIILLTVTLVMPEGQDDITQSREVSSIEDCMSSARAWLDQDAQTAGGIGFAAMCQKVERPKS